MRKLVMGAVLLMLAGWSAAQEVDMVGAWTVYQIDQLANYTMSDYTAGRTEVSAEGNLQIDVDGTVIAEGLDFDAWRMEDGFFVLQNSAGNSFFAVRPISPDVYFLTNLTVTERNREVTHIRMNRRQNLLVVRQ
ncbi:MAG: hypothetical protein EA384_08730 [Spirochaetaceae bacterium]|nr:MAG: hypothetical protein EA384_08730 [Spirochaetaceae bacterium]